MTIRSHCACAGYSVPLTGFLSTVRGGKRRLSMDFSSPLEGVFIEDMIVKVSTFTQQAQHSHTPTSMHSTLHPSQRPGAP